MRRLMLVLGGGAVLAMPSVAVAETRTVVARLVNATTVKEFRDLALVSVYDFRIRRYRLTLIRPDGRQQRLPVIVSRTPFDADIGPGPDGAPTVVYARRGNLWRLRAGARRPRRLLGASKGLSQPTIWGRRLAYVRGARTVLVRGVDWPWSRRSVVRPGVPRRACDGRCVTLHGSVGDLELRGHTLALLVGFGARYYDEGAQQIRVDDTITAKTRTVWESGNGGLSGYVTDYLSFADGWLGWQNLCSADPSGCYGSPGIMRVKGRHLQVARGRYVPLSGLALTRHGSLQLVARGEQGFPLDQCHSTIQRRCELVRTGPLDWHDVPFRTS